MTIQFWGRKFLLGISFFFFFSIVLFGQENNSFTLKGKVVDEKSGEIIIGANIYNRLFDIGTSTDRKGKFELEVSQLPVYLEVSYVGYNDLEIRISKITKEAVTVFLKPASGELPTAVVSATRETTEILEKKDRILDFEFFGQNTLLLIKNLKEKKERLELRNSEDEVLDSYIVEGINGAKKFHKTCLGSIDVINGKKVFPVVMEDDIILGFGEPVDFHTYHWEVMKCEVATRENVYYQLYNYYGQHISYHLFEKDLDTNYVFATVQNEEQIRLLFDDMVPLILTDTYGNDMMIDSWEELKKVRDMQEDLDGKMQFFYQPIYAPIFAKNDELVLFDCFSGEINFYKKNGECIRSVDIGFQTEKKWEDEIVQDIGNENFYVVFSTQTGKAISEINLMNGELKEPIYFNSNNFDKIEIKDGFAYFLENDVDPIFNYSINVLKKVKID